MSYLKHGKSNACGRLPKKPKTNNAHEISDDEENLPLQTQIDNLRAKISLKERYNKALQEEYNESHQGAHQMIHELLTDNEILRHDKNEAIKSGNAAAVKALRNHRTFMLTLRGRTPEQVLEWLDDQIGDLRKSLDEKLDQVKKIKCRLGEAERMVEELESFPFPGSSPWEQAFIEDFTRLGVAIADQQALRDAVDILGKKYMGILTELRGARDKWPYTVKKMEVSYRDLKSELDDLQSMLNDAKRLKKNTLYRLVMTEKEYSENRKIRHHRLHKIRKMCQLEMAKNRKKYQKNRGDDKSDETGVRRTKSKHYSETHNRVVKDERDVALIERLEEQRVKVGEFEERARTLVNAMRVNDLRYCPQRIRSIVQLGRILREERDQKEVQMKVLLNQRNNLLLIKNHLCYTGRAQVEEFEQECKRKSSQLEQARSATSRVTEKLNKIGDNAVTLHTALIGLLENLQEGKRFHHKIPDDYLTLGKVVYTKIKHLAETVKDLSSYFDPEVEPQRNYAVYVKIPISRDACRLGTLRKAITDEESSDDEDIGLHAGIGQDRVLVREDIKNRSNKIYAQGMLRKGFEGVSNKKDERIRKKRSKFQQRLVRK